MVDRQETGPREAARAPVVMVVEDDAEMRALLREVLAAQGLAVKEEASGESLVEALEPGTPDLLVLDKELPGPSGLDLLSYISRRHPALPVILVTAFGGAAVRDEALRMGAVAYLEKPFRTGALLEAVLRLLSRTDAIGAPGRREAS